MLGRLGCAQEPFSVKSSKRCNGAIPTGQWILNWEMELPTSEILAVGNIATLRPAPKPDCTSFLADPLYDAAIEDGVETLIP